MKPGIYYDPIYLKHDTGMHPENSKRLEAIEQHLDLQEGLSEYDLRRAKRADIDEISLIHSTAHIHRVEDACKDGERYLGTPDCAISADTYEVALHAVGAVLDAVIEVGENRMDNAFCAVRPPGHHAESDTSLGFCYFNNIAIAAEFLIKKMGFQRVLVFDFDVHHGNGTQHSFENRKDVFYASIHQDPRTCYPGTGFAQEKGSGEGNGYTLNCPMAPFSKDEDYLHVFNQMLMPAFEAYQPDFVLVSAGFDAHRDDPLAQIEITETAYEEMTRGLKQLAERFAQGRLVSVLEGGYDLQALARSVQRHLSVLKEGPSRISDLVEQEQLKKVLEKKE